MSLDTGVLNSLYKVAYAKSYVDLVPPTGKIMKLVDFVPAEMQNGKHYELPVILTQEAGFTYSLDTQSAYALNDSIGMSMASAIVPGFDLVLSSTVGYNQAARASHSATSFKSVMSVKFDNMLKSAEKRLEINFLYGQSHIAKASVQQVVIANSLLPMVIDAAEWATGIWTASEGAQVVFVQASDNTAIDSLRSFTVAKVDVDSRTVYFAAGTQGTPGALATLETAIESVALNIHWFGSCSGSAGTFAFAETAGLKKIMTNSSTLFGIDASQYDLWKGNTVTVSGQLTMSKVLAAVSRAVQRGLDTKVALMVNPNTWADLASNLAALRRFDGSYSRKKAENGSEVLEYVSQNGVIEVHSYNLVKEGDAFIFPPDHALRVGARKLGLNDPTRSEDDIFFTLPGYAGVGLRAYSNQAIFVEKPACTVYINGIVNNQQ
jgi:hypothetical protein